MSVVIHSVSNQLSPHFHFLYFFKHFYWQLENFQSPKSTGHLFLGVKQLISSKEDYSDHRWPPSDPVLTAVVVSADKSCPCPDVGASQTVVLAGLCPLCAEICTAHTRPLSSPQTGPERRRPWQYSQLKVRPLACSNLSTRSRRQTMCHCWRPSLSTWQDPR